MMFRFFESLIEPTAQQPDGTPPLLGSPHALWRFYWYYVRQIPGLLIALFVTGLAVALLDAAVPVCIGRVVSLVSEQQQETVWQEAAPQLVLMAALFLVLRPLAHLMQHLISNQALIPGLTNLVRWQNHWHVIRQGWTFFQNDFAGRIAARVMQTGPNLRESVVGPGHADRAQSARERRGRDQRCLVHPGLRHQRGRAAGRRR